MEYDVFSNVSLVLDIITHLVDQVEMIDKLNPTNIFFREKFGGIPLGLLTLRDTSSPGYVADATPLRDSVVMWRPNAGSQKGGFLKGSQMGFWLCFYNLKDLFFWCQITVFFCFLVLTFVDIG